MPKPGPGRPGVAAILALSGGRRWGWGLVTFARSRTHPGPRGPPAAPPLASRGFPRKLDPRCFLTRQPLGPAGGARDSPRDAENPLPHHRMVAAITVTRRDVAPPPPEKKKPEDGARLERSEQAQGAATQCAGVNRNSARELEAGRWVVLECRRRVAGVRRRTSQAAALAEAWSGPRSCSSSAYVQAPPSGASCATRSFGTATWSPGLVVADQRARNLEGGGAGGALVEGLSRARPEGARVASQACVMPVASPILRQTPAMDCLLTSLAFSHQP